MSGSKNYGTYSSQEAEISTFLQESIMPFMRRRLRDMDKLKAENDKMRGTVPRKLLGRGELRLNQIVLISGFHLDLNKQVEFVGRVDHIGYDRIDLCNRLTGGIQKIGLNDSDDILLIEDAPHVEIGTAIHDQIEEHLTINNDATEGPAMAEWERELLGIRRGEITSQADLQIGDVIDVYGTTATMMGVTVTGVEGGASYRSVLTSGTPYRSLQEDRFNRDREIRLVERPKPELPTDPGSIFRVLEFDGKAVDFKALIDFSGKLVRMDGEKWPEMGGLLTARFAHNLVTKFEVLDA